MSLLANRRFWPLLITHLLTSLNDHFVKTAVILTLLYKLAQTGAIWATLASAIYILPFVLLSSLGGELADKYERAKLIRICKLAEIAIVALGLFGIFAVDRIVMYTAIFLMGLHSAIYSPARSALMPQQFEEQTLLQANAWLEGGATIMVLLGIVAAGIFMDISTTSAAFFSFMVALGGYGVSCFIDKAPAGEPHLKVNYNILESGLKILRAGFQSDRTALPILAIGWFYFAGTVFLTQVPNFAKTNLLAGESMATAFLAVFAIGFAAGGALSSALLKKEINGRYAPLSLLGFSLFCFDLYIAGGAKITADQGLVHLLAQPAAWRVLGDLFMLAVCGGLFVIPLTTVLQTVTANQERARIFASSNLINALFGLLSAGASALLLASGLSSRDLFLCVAIANLLVALYACGLLPHYLLKTLLAGALKLLYRVEVRGLEHWPMGKPVLISANHVSLLDPVLLAVFLPGRPVFAVHTQVARWWWVRPWLKIIRAYSIDPANPFSMRGLIRALQEGLPVVIFPEGRLTETGHLMKIYEGTALIAERAGVPLMPVYLQGVEHTPFAPLKNKVRQQLFPKITLTLLPPQPLAIPAEITGRARRSVAARALYDVMVNMAFAATNHDRTLVRAVLDAGHEHGQSCIILEDIDHKPLSYKKLRTAQLVLGSALKKYTQKGNAVGVLLPNSTGLVVTILALQFFERVPALLNFSTGFSNMLSACQTAGLKTIITSRRFVEHARLGEVLTRFAGKFSVIYLEDLKKELGLGAKLTGSLASPFAGFIHAKQKITADHPAVILFTSGSEGSPKAVVLSHRNILANCLQLSAVLDFTRQDRVLNALPCFHSFGLTGGTILPLVSGIYAFTYPSPLHYRIVPEMAYHANASIMFGTDTFLSGYGRVAHPYDFYRMRLVFAGAEKLKDATRKIWMDKFAVRILEGYGTTETGPALAVNTPFYNKPNSVGRFLPGIEARLTPVPGVKEGGQLHVRGPNIMLGYYKSDKPGELQPPPEGWYDTGDIIAVDADGFISIKGRAKRFAKIAGEMVSLTVVEEIAAHTYPEAMHAVVAISDPRKGEQLVLMTTFAQADRAALAQTARAQGLTELFVPRQIIALVKLPLLGSGKLDYPAIQKLAESSGSA